MKKFVCLVLTFFFFYISVRADIDINSKNGIMYNLNDDIVIYEKNTNSEEEIASLTKIMTAIIVIENTNLDDEIVIERRAFNGLEGYALAGLKVGDKVTVRDLLYALMLPSGAEAGNMLSFAFTESQDDFIELMNNKAIELGLDNTHFDNPIGIDSQDNYSTAADLAILLKYALKNETFKQIYTATEYTTSNGLKLSRTIDKYANGLDISLIKGDKTGHTEAAGYCLSSISTIDGIDYLIITLGAETTKEFISDHVNLYNYYSTNYSYRNILNDKQLLVSIPIKNGKKDTLEIYSDKEIKKYLNNDLDLSKIVYEYNGIELITKNVKIDDKLGTITIKYDDEVLDTYDVYLKEKIEYKFEFGKLIKWVISLIGIYLFIKLLFKRKRRRKRRVIKRK